MAKPLPLPAAAIFLFAAIIIYGVAGSPTPDNPGWPEIAVGVCLVLAAGLGGMKRLTLLGNGAETVFLRSLQVLFFVGLVLPVVTGVLHGNDPMLIFRDILAFLFLCLPLFLTGTIARHDKASDFLPYVLVFMGLIFAVRTLVPAFHVWIAPRELLYLSNSPIVLFAALFLVCLLWEQARKPSAAALLKGTVYLSGAGIVLAAMLLDVQRATIGAIALTVIVLWFDTLLRMPRRVVVPTLLLAVAGYAGAPWLVESIGAIYRKTSEVGLNMRGQELEAVFTMLSADPLRFFFGTGWGGVFSSPAVGMRNVNYTHSLLSTMFLKGGVTLLVLTGAVCLAAIHQIILIFQRDRGKGLSVLWPFLIPVFLYASHKSLDFGLLLLLIGVWSDRAGRLHKTA